MTTADPAGSAATVVRPVMTRFLPSSVFAIWLTGAASALAQPIPAIWQVGDGAAHVTNGESRFGVACRSVGDGRLVPVLVFEAPAGADYGDSVEARLQISTTADAYQIDTNTEIDTTTWTFRLDVSGDAGRYVAAESGSREAPDIGVTLDRLRAGLNLVIGAAPFDRAQRYSLVGSNRAIGIVLAGCG